MLIALTPPLSSCEFAALLECLAPGTHVAVGVSGGADSMALALLAQEWAQATGRHAVALTVDHGLRAESAGEARQVSEWLRARGIDHHILTWRHGKMHGNVQAQARKARYGLMGEWCQSHGIRHLLVAHHLEDQAETVLLRLKRGSHVEGLAAMQPVTDLRNGVRLLRPLLSISKTRLRATLHAMGQEWLEDASNANTAYDRVRARNLLATQPDAARMLAHAAAQLASARKKARDEMAGLEFQVSRAHGQIQWKIADFAVTPPALAAKFLGRLIARVGGQEYPPRFTSLERLQRDLSAGIRARTLGGCIIAQSRGFISVRRECRTGRPRQSVVG